MQQTDSKTLPLNSAYAFGVEQGLEKEIAEIRYMEIEWDLSYTSTVRRGFIAQLFESKGILSLFIEKHWPIGSTVSGERQRQFYLRIRSRYEAFLSGKSNDIEDEVEALEVEDQQFAAEADLRNVLAANLDCIESGLQLYEAAGKTGIEFSIDDGRIDILAVDKDHKYVVIELKLSRGRNKTIGQLLYYMGWVDTNLGRAPCRGIIIAKDIPDDLKLAVRRVSGISLFRYKLQVSVEPVQ
jgi:hypothetical protein